MPIQLRVEGQRGCGWRKPGGLYMVSGGPPSDCGRFPIYLDVCPCCGAGIKPTRGWTWVDGAKLAEDTVCLRDDKYCESCPMSLIAAPDCNASRLSQIGKCGLLWIGEAFYKTTEDFMAEARRVGISRRVPAVPNDFVLGKTWVMLAHRKYETEIDSNKEIHKAAIFGIFKPVAIEYVVTGEETPADIKALEKRGLTPIKIKRSDDQLSFNPG